MKSNYKGKISNIKKKEKSSNKITDLHMKQASKIKLDAMDIVL